MMPRRVDIYVPSAQQAAANAVMEDVTGQAADANTFTITKSLGGSTYYWSTIVFDLNKNDETQSQYERFRGLIITIPGAFWYEGDSRQSLYERLLTATNSASAAASIGGLWTVADSDTDVPNATPPVYETIYVASNGSASAAGTEVDPFDLRTVIEGYITFTTAFLLDWMEAPAVDWNCSGTIRAATPWGAGVDFVNAGNRQSWGNLILEDVILMSSYTTRETTETGSDPSSIEGGSLHFRGPTTLNRVILHDFNESVGVWGTAEPFAANDCLSFNHGWNAPDRGHGHCWYIQHKDTTNKAVFTRVISFNGYGGNIRIYGTDTPAALKGVEFHDSVSLSNYKSDSNHAGDGPLDSRALVGSGGAAIKAEAIVFDAHHFIGVNVQLGFQDTQNISATLQNSYVDADILQINNWDALTQTGNRIRAGQVTKVGGAETLAGIDSNTYYDDDTTYVVDGVGSGDLAFWQTYYDALSTNEAGLPPDGVEVVAGSGHILAWITVYNYTLQSSVNVDLTALALDDGTYTLRQLMDVFGDVRAAVVSSNSLTIDMSAASVAIPTGAAEALHNTTLPQKGVFWLTDE